MQRYNLDIVELSETQMTEEVNLREFFCGYSWYWKGRVRSLEKEADVSILIKNDLVKRLEVYLSILN